MTKEALAAVRLMRMALALLDNAGEPIATARLQHAIDYLADQGGTGAGAGKHGGSGLSAV